MNPLLRCLLAVVVIAVLHALVPTLDQPAMMLGAILYVAYQILEKVEKR